VTVTIRRMTEADVEPASRVQVAAFDDLDRREGREPHPITDPAAWEQVYYRHRHFITHDPDGSWVALEGDQVIGSALALKRDTLWGLSLLVVDPAVQSSGAGRALLDASLAYAEDCDRAVIMSTTDPRAIRAYATSGFALYPQVQGLGAPDRTSLPVENPRVREGSLADVEFVDDVDRAVRGAPRGPDHVRMASQLTMYVVDDAAGRGYGYIRRDGEIYCLAATNEDAAAALLWRCFAHAVEIDKPITLPSLDAAQQWAITACFTARLKVTPAGPVFWRGITPPTAYLPSGAYL
jgi:GNAT superfamily N-acetyltransferase